MKLYSVLITLSLGVVVVVASQRCALSRKSNSATEGKVHYEKNNIVKRQALDFLSVIETFLSIGKTVTEVLDLIGNLKEKFRGTAVLKIDNYYKAPLNHPKSWTDKGITKTYPKDVPSGYKGALAVFGKGDGRGVEFLTKYKLRVDEYEIDVYAYLRVEQEDAWRKENKFGIGIVKASSNSNGYANAEDMDFMEIKEFGSESHIIIHCYRKLVCVSGTFSAGHQAKGLIKILPVKVEDFAEGEIRDCAAGSQDELNDELKYGVDRTRIAEKNRIAAPPVRGDGEKISPPKMLILSVGLCIALCL
ncbi:hypothetical protein EB796_019725 [Bugula neritina]|uniref:Uncharacterized protein n=1 Tax=Bugula neritina TaxID=10212 RepID=A0A7J7J766_BUGNE|nr:hypothetical protein EB796_019725 [Bugula neritina]